MKLFLSFKNLGFGGAYSRGLNADRILIFSGWIVMVTRHALYFWVRAKFLGESRFWVRAKSAEANCPTKMGADCCRGGVISRIYDNLNIYHYFLIIIIRVDSDGNEVCACRWYIKFLELAIFELFLWGNQPQKWGNQPHMLFVFIVILI